MPRRPRIEFPGALYHVFTRGNRKQRVFSIKNDYIKYLHLIINYKERYGFKLYAYALMPNHIHLLIETGEIPLSTIMQGLQQSYTQYFNLKHTQVGHVFQGRYKAILCEKDVYLMELVRYIHLNPIRARLVDDLKDYPWTGHIDYLHKRPKPLTDVSFVLSQMNNGTEQARKQYLRFILDGLGANTDLLEHNLQTQQVLGDEQFTTENLREIGSHEQPAARESESVKRIEKIIPVLCQTSGISTNVLQSNVKLPDVVATRRLVSYFARTLCSMSIKMIAAKLNIEKPAVSKGIHWVRERMQKDKAYRKEVEDIEKVLKNV